MVELKDLIEVYYRARKNKRRSPDTLKFEVDFEANLVNLQKKINSRELTADSNYAFVVFSPKPVKYSQHQWKQELFTIIWTGGFARYMKSSFSYIFQ